MDELFSALARALRLLDLARLSVDTSPMSPGSIARAPIVAVTALADWNSQIHAIALPGGLSELEIATRTLSYVGRVITNALSAQAPEVRFDVTLRVYGGWHRGFEVTPRRKAVITVGAQTLPLSTRPTVLIRPNVEFGDRLISGSLKRLHPRLNIHLGDTYCYSIRDKDRLEEKMVDTALAADLVDLAHSDPERWLVVIGEDDDLIPPLIVADSIRQGKSGRVIIVRHRKATPFLRFRDLRISP